MLENKLFHGSNTLITDEYLTPHISFDYEPFVYATDNLWYALVRCGKFNVDDFAIKEDYIDACHKFTLVELRENAFNDVFNTSGYIYILDKNDFMCYGNEYRSHSPVKIQRTLYVENVWERMQSYMGKIAYDLIKFDKSDSYFKKVGCNKEEYFERRKERSETLKRYLTNAK